MENNALLGASRVRLVCAYARRPTQVSRRAHVSCCAGVRVRTTCSTAVLSLFLFVER